MHSLAWLISTVVSLYIFFVIAWVVLSWLVNFNVVNRHNQFVRMVGDFLHGVTAPALRPIQRVVPYIGGIDISPLILIILLHFIRNLILEFLL